jgi:hypothetical protein
MKRIEINNKEINNLLNDFSTWFEKIDKSKINLIGEPDKNEYYTGEEYFNSIDQDDHDGYPQVTYGTDIGIAGSTTNDMREKIRNIDGDFNSILGSKHCAVKMYYPNGGFMGWHNNHNAHGYNILFSYTKNGNGFFRFKETDVPTTITIQDSPGWTAKVGYYGSNSEPDKLFWHCARAYEDRLTLGFVIPDKEFWEMMIEDIESK